jgi:hypothetical protein
MITLMICLMICITVFAGFALWRITSFMEHLRSANGLHELQRVKHQEESDQSAHKRYMEMRELEAPDERVLNARIAEARAREAEASAREAEIRTRRR